MIKETEQGNQIHWLVWPDKDKNKKILLTLINKIKTKQKEPFVKIFVTLFPPYFAPLVLLCQKENVNIKNLNTNRKQIFIEF